MAIGASGLYGLSLEKMLLDTLGEDLELEDHNQDLVLDAYTPAYDTHDFHLDLTNVVSGGNYAQETIVSTEVTLASGTLTYDHADVVYDNAAADDVTISDAMAAVMSTNVGASATDQLIYLLDFVTAASCTNSTFTVQINALGAFTIDYTP
jgi:hypothetical protein